MVKSQKTAELDVREVPLQLSASMNAGMIAVCCTNLAGETLKTFEGLFPQETGFGLARLIGDQIPAASASRWKPVLPSNELLDDRPGLCLPELFELSEEP